MYDLGILNGLVYIHNDFIKTNIYIKDGLIKNISTSLLETKDTYDCKGNLVLPGIIDPHTHFDLDLGFTTSKDTFKTGTIAAAFGGVTTIIDFLDPVGSKKELQTAFLKRKKQAQDSVIDYKFHACLKNPKGKVPELLEGFREYGLNTVKIFTTYSDSNRRTYDPEIRELLTYSKKENYTVTAHIENDDLITLKDTALYQDLPYNRPTSSEVTEALKLAQMTKETNGRLYMVHCSSGDTVEALEKEYSDILNKDFIVESCPHYFLWNKEKLQEDKGYLYTMAPPLRSEAERQKLQSKIKNIHTIGTDHCTFHQDEKKKTFLKDMPLGIGGVEESFRVLYSLFGKRIIPKMTSNVAKAHHLYPQKGVIQVDSDADLFIYKVVDTTISKYHSNSDHSLYIGTPVNGEIISTISRGKFVVKDKQFIKQRGTLLNKIGGTYEGT